MEDLDELGVPEVGLELLERLVEGLPALISGLELVVPHLEEGVLPLVVLHHDGLDVGFLGKVHFLQVLQEGVSGVGGMG